MAIHRAAENPTIRPQDIRPSREDFEVIGVFNAAVARYGDEVILLLRVAERPVGGEANVVLCPIYEVEAGRITVRPFARDDPRYDFSDPRLIVARASPVSRASCPRVAKASRLQSAGGTPATRQGQDALATHKGETPAPRRNALGTTETFLTSISHLRLARGTDGRRFQVAAAPALEPANAYETFGLEDPRITCLDGVYYIQYVAVSPLGVTTCLASTRDFESYERHGVIFHPDNKDVAIFPAPVGGKFYALHRPHSSLFLRNDIWIGASPDLLSWGDHRHLLGTRDGRWDEVRIGAGAVPFRTEQGWIELYHGADRHNRYCLGAVLLEGEQPWKVLARSDTPVFEPEADYEQAGFFGNVVFSCGLLFEDEILKVYYGAADTAICYAEIPLADVYQNLGL